jgi:hypothetical protein
MSFLRPDEYIILMDHPSLSPDDLLRIREAGVRTLYAYVSWQQTERQPGVYDWSAADAWLERAGRADMQVLLRCYEQAPTFFPADWYLRTADGVLWRDLPGWGDSERHTLLSPWCQEAMAAEQAFMRECRARYAGERVLCYAGTTHSGEVLLPGMVACWYDSHARTDFHEFMGSDRAVPADLPTYAAMRAQPQTVLWLSGSLTAYVGRQQANFPEIWLALVERATRPVEDFGGARSGNWLRRELCEQLPGELGKPLNILLFEIYRAEGLQGALDSLAGYEERTWVGSQFCEGLRANTADAIARGLRGFITAPVHDYRPGRLEPWMLDTLRWSLAQWRAARG